MEQIPGTYDRVRRALEHLLERMADDKARGKAVDRGRLLDETGMRFNLSPAEAASLERLLAGRTDSPAELTTRRSR